MAGIDQDGNWIRIYPIRFRYLEDDKQFTKYSIVKALVRKNEKDFRSDSFKIDSDSIQILSKMGTDHSWQARNSIVLPTVASSIETIKERYESTSHSLGIFKPKEIFDFIVEVDKESARVKQNEFIKQLTLFDPQAPKNLKPLPYKFSYRFNCNHPNCKGHKYIILDWEIYAAFFAWEKKYGLENAINMIQKKWMDEMFAPSRDTYLIVGTTFPNPTFTVLGVYWPPVNLQYSLF